MFLVPSIDLIIVHLSLSSSPQCHQLAQDLGRAFSDRAILQTFIEAETTVSGGPLKVNKENFSHTLRISA